MGDTDTFHKRHGLKKVTVATGEIALERSIGPLVFRRQRLKLASIDKARFHSRTREASEPHGKFEVLVSGFTLVTTNGPPVGWWSRTISREPWHVLAAVLASRGVRLESIGTDATGVRLDSIGTAGGRELRPSTSRSAHRPASPRPRPSTSRSARRPASPRPPE
jgi:hypothetical protein